MLKHLRAIKKKVHEVLWKPYIYCILGEEGTWGWGWETEVGRGGEDRAGEVEDRGGGGEENEWGNGEDCKWSKEGGRRENTESHRGKE